MSLASRRLHFGRYDYAAFASFFSYSSLSIAIPMVLIDLASELGFPLEAGGMGAGGGLHVLRTTLLVCSMVTCGFLAGRWGMRRVMGAAVLLMGLAAIVCSWAPSYLWLLLALGLSGLGEGIIEGLATPFVQRLHPEEPGRYINFAHAFWPVGITVTTLLTGHLLERDVSWRLLVGAISSVSFLAALILLLPRSESTPAFPEPLEKTHWRQHAGEIRMLLSSGRFRRFLAAMFFIGGGEFGLTFWIASFVRMDFGLSAWVSGVATAVFAAGMFLGRTGWAHCIRQRNLKQLVVFSALASIVTTCSLPWSPNTVVLMVLLALTGFSVAPFWPSTQSYCAQQMPHADPTTIFIFLSCAGVPGCGAMSYLMGLMGDLTGDLTYSVYLAAGCFALVAILVGYEWLLSKPPAEHASEICNSD